ncbi:hypothetical protein LJC17_02565 [Acholeplasma sp. OttesenSCG-928-E16]|nr:hypothetical protein [Acholeplasma sp. OttesenSCG-928-E16]
MNENAIKPYNVKKRKAIAISKFIVYCYSSQTLGFLICLVFNLLATTLVGIFADSNEAKAGSYDIVAISWIAIIGVAFFKSTFTFSIQNGLSRKTYFITSLLISLLTSFAWSLLTVSIEYLADAIGSPIIIFAFMYKMDFISMFIWTFGALTFAFTFGWFIRMVLYRTSKRGKLIILGSILLAALIILFVTLLTKVNLGGALGTLFSYCLGLKMKIPNPYIAFSFFIGLSLIFSIGNYLLIRKAPAC